MADEASRRKFIRNMAAASAAVGTAVGCQHSVAQQAGRVRGFDHVALPMENTDAMLAFYRALGCDVVERDTACSVYFGDNMINFHRPGETGHSRIELLLPCRLVPSGTWLELEAT